MSEYELNDIKTLLMKLKKLVELYGGKYYTVQLGIISKIIDCIDSDLSTADKEIFVIRNYKNLYPPQGGLSDFYIHHDQYEERLKLNKPLDEINNSLWDIFKKYM